MGRGFSVLFQFLTEELAVTRGRHSCCCVRSSQCDRNYFSTNEHSTDVEAQNFCDDMCAELASASGGECVISVRQCYVCGVTGSSNSNGDGHGMIGLM